MTTDPPIYTGVCPYCASAISTVTLEGGKAYARCSHRRCGARGPLMANTERAVDVFTRGKWSIRGEDESDLPRLPECLAADREIVRVVRDWWDSPTAYDSDLIKRVSTLLTKEGEGTR